MITKTVRTDYKLKNCTANGSGQVVDEHGEVVELGYMLGLIFGACSFDLSASSSKKDELDEEDLTS